VLHASTATVIKELKKSPAVANRQSETVESAAEGRWRWSKQFKADEETAVEESELDAPCRVMWVKTLGGGRHAIDHKTGQVLAYVFGRRKSSFFSI